jgi:uncharacterized protein
METIQTQASNQNSPQPPFDANQFSSYIHLSSLVNLFVPFGGFVLALVLWSTKRSMSDFVDRNGKESLNFQISMAIWWTICVVLVFLIIGLLLMIPLFLIGIIYPIKASMSAQKGEVYRYPFIFRFIN